MVNKSTFVAVIEQSPKMAFEIKWDGDSVPHDIKFPDGSKIVLVGKYASQGERFCYRRIRCVELNEDDYKIVDYHKMAGISG